MSKISFVKRVMNALSGGDEGKVTRFQSKAVKFCKDQIRIRNSKIEELKEGKTDLEEEFEDATIAIDLEAIVNAESSKKHAEEYVTGLLKRTSEITSVEEEISELEKEIKVIENLLKKIED